MLKKKFMIKNKMKIAIVGAGYIARKYLETLTALEEYKVVGIYSKTYVTSKKLYKEFKIKNLYKSIEELINDNEINAIFILVSYDQIFKITKKLLPLKIPLLIEKPTGTSFEEANTLANLSIKYKTKNMVALNRRFYSIFNKGLEVINKHGGIKNIVVEGHERFWKIENAIPKRDIKKWIYINSIHNIDLLRFFGGEIKSLNKIKKKDILKNGNQFLALINFKNNMSGLYHSNWYAPGGWSVKLFGNGITVIFSPLEKGYYLDINLKKTYLKPSQQDKKYKAGFYLQLKAFSDYVLLNKKHKSIQNLQDVKKTMSLIKLIQKD